MGIESLFNYTADVLGRVVGADTPITNDEENHPIPSVSDPETLATVPCAVQERSARERASLVNIGAVASTHRVYMVAPNDQYGDPVRVDESRTLYIQELGLDLSIDYVRDGGGRGHHLEIDATEIRS